MPGHPLAAPPRAVPGLDEFLDWDTVSWSPVLEAWSRHLPADLAGAEALELGAGRGGLSLWLALRGASVLCSDLADPEPLASPLHTLWPAPARIRYAALDATDLQHRDRFDIIVFKSILGTLPRPDAPAQALMGIHRALKPGGLLLFAENLAASPFHRFFRRHFVRWGRRWTYATVPGLRSLLSAFEGVDIETTGVLGAFGRTPAQRRLLGHLDRLAMNHLVSSQWHYIAYGMARKPRGPGDPRA